MSKGCLFIVTKAFLGISFKIQNSNCVHKYKGNIDPVYLLRVTPVDDSPRTNNISKTSESVGQDFLGNFWVSLPMGQQGIIG